MSEPTALFDTRSLTALRSTGGILPTDLIAAVIAGTDVPGMNPADYHLELGDTPSNAANRAWAALKDEWGSFQKALHDLPSGAPTAAITRDRWLSKVMRALGFRRISATPAGGITTDGRSYPVSHLAEEHLACHLLGWGTDLDRRTPGVAGAAGQAPQAMVQELLNRSDKHLWALLSNGQLLRVLRDSSTLVGPAFVEFDLAAIFNDDLFPDFVALWLICHQSRSEPSDPEIGQPSCWLERWRGHAAETGARALGALRIGVHDAIEVLGTGFIRHPANADLRERLDTRQLSADDLRHGLLRLVYRLLFCFVAEDRDLLLDPEAKPDIAERYRQWFSTARLRRLAIRRAGDNHTDHWHTLRLVIDALGNEQGCPELGLVGLGGIFDPGPGDLDAAWTISNRDLLTAIRHLCVTRPDRTGPRRVVDYRHLGAEELGGIYESLLEYVPKYDPIQRTFTLAEFSGNERKKTGAYYTPTSLTECLLDTALDPLLDRAEAADDPEAALLALTVCDPACGSGHFLVAAGRRIAARLAAFRAAGAEPTLEQVHDAMHDVVERCLYGVDVNPLAAELAKVSLWLEGLQGGRPLGLLDGHIKVGNALLGATPALLAGGIPDEAYSPIEGDDKKITTELKRRNKRELAGQGGLALPGASVTTTALADAMAAIDALHPTDLAAVHAAAQSLRLADDAASDARLLADAWCSAFVLPKTHGAPQLTTATLTAIEAGTASLDLLDAITTVTARYRWFHWHIEFPHIFQPGASDSYPITGWVGGFACVIGNPPWERVKLQEQEWFASRMPAIAEAPNANARKKLIDALKDEHPELHAEFRADRRQAEGESHFLRNSGRYPLTGRGDINTYAVFAETDRSLLGSTGRLGVILPTGIATDATTQYFFKDLVNAQALVALLSFENEDRVFEGVHNQFKFCLLTLVGSLDVHPRADFAFFLRHPRDLAREGAKFSLTPEEIILLNPNTGTCPVFRSRRDAEITLSVYRRHPVLMQKDAPDGNPWGLSFMRMIDMSNDSGLFRTRQELEGDGWTLLGNIFSKREERMLPLYEGKMVNLFNHRFGTYEGQTQAQANKGFLPQMSDVELASPSTVSMARYWVASRDVDSRLAGRWDKPWLLGFRDICRSVDERTMIPSMLPVSGVGHKLPLLLLDEAALAFHVAISSFAFDFVARQKVGGTSMGYFIIEQLPVPTPKTFYASCPWAGGDTVVDWLAVRGLELTYTSWDMEPFARSFDDYGTPFVWDPERRVVLRAELDASMFHIYGYDRDESEYVLSTFPIVNRKDPGLASRVLDAYDRIAKAIESGEAFVSSLDPPPGEGRRHPDLV